MAELGDEEMVGIIPQKESKYVEEWQDFGWYKDEYGITRYGVIPKQRNDINFNYDTWYDDGRIRTSNTRFN